ncbi:MAG: methyltransferase [Spirochaetales bacterium]|jgi:hypothetical protein|nr:methyltransferase [Spirochaetales bacterium]
MNELIEKHLNKRVDFSFAGERIELDLSLSLFSSFTVDTGSKLLLKSVVQNIELKEIDTLVDLGCGTGVLGICLQRKLPGATCVFQDRDALALEFTESNCELNGTADNAEFAGGLAFQQLNGRKFGLVLSNLPAKAGQPVLEGMIADALGHLEIEGTAAVVIVMPLADFLGAAIERLGGLVVHTEETRDHRVYHIQKDENFKGTGETASHLKPYIRHSGDFAYGPAAWRMDTVFNLPDFDNIGRNAALTLDLLNSHLAGKTDIEGDTLIWNPGQGHTASVASGIADIRLGTIYLGSRDALQIEICTRNLENSGVKNRIVPLHLPSLSLSAGVIPSASLGLLFLLPPADGGSVWQEQAAEAAAGLLQTGGLVIAGASSTGIHRLLHLMRGMVLHGSRKKHGARAVVLKKSV